MKKLLALALLLCLSMQAMAETWTDSNGIVWSFTVSEGKAIDVKPYNKSSIPVNLVIPGKMNSYPVISVGDHAFSNCEELISISIPSSVTIIKNDAFFNCPKMESVTLTRGLKTIEQRAFSTHSNYLKDIDVPEGVTSIGNNAFADNPALESVNLPSSLSSLGGYVFYQCNNLRMVNANSSTPLYIYQTLYPYSATLYVPVGSKAAYKSANYWKEFVNVQEVGYTGKTDSELTGETDISCFYVNRPGLLGNFFVQAGKPIKVKITGEVSPADLEALSKDGYSSEMYYTIYVDLSDANIHAGSYYNRRQSKWVDTSDGFFDADWLGCNNSENDDTNWYGPTTIVLPNSITEFEGWVNKIYSTQTSPFKTTIRRPSGDVYGVCKFHVPAGTKVAWEAQTTYPGNVLFYDGPVKTISVQTAGTLRNLLTTQEIATVNELNVTGTINAVDFATMKQMKSLTLLNIYASIVAYEGTGGPVNSYTSYRMGEVPAGTFQNNKNLQNVSIGQPYGINGLIIGDYAFDGCTRLIKFTCRGFSSLGDFCFRNTKVKGALLLGTKKNCYTNGYEDDNNPQTEYNREFEHIGLQPFFGVMGSSSAWDYARYMSETSGFSGDDYYDDLYILDNFTVIPGYWTNFGSYFSERPFYSGVTNKSETLLYALSTTQYYNLTLPSSITTLSDYAASGLQIRSINLSSVTTIGDAFLYQCPLLQSITCNNTAYKSVDDVLYTADKKTLVKYPCAKTAEELIIPSTVEQISKWAFEGSQNLKTITIEATTPPTLAGQAFDDFNVAGITLYVPAGSKAAYEAANYWKEFKEIVEMPAPESGIAEGMVLPWGTEQAWEMKYMYLDQIGNEPAVDGAGRSWTNVGYDDSSWGTLTGPIASNSTYFTSVNTIWEKEGGCYYLRRTFELDKVNEGGYTFLSKHDDKLQVWINGSQVISADYNGNLQSYHIPATAFVNGTNTLAILVEDYGGDANLDYSLCNLFYLKNVETGKYLNKGNSWGTHAVLSDEPLPASISKQPDGSYTIYFPIGSNYQQMLYRANEEDVYVDYNKDFDGAYPYWTITEAGNGNYRIQTLTTHETYGQTAMPGTYLGNNPNKEAHDAGGGALGRYNDVDGNVSSTGNITWQLVPEGLHTAAQAERLRELITQANSLYDINTHIAQNVLENEQAGYTEMMLQILQLEGWINDCIGFEDEAVKTLCVAKWDTNHDGELSRAEAGAVTDLGEVFKGNTEITSFNELQYFTGLTEIGNNAFEGCTALLSVKFPSTLTRIGDSSFYGCKQLKNIDFDGLSASIETCAFLGCEALEHLVLPANIHLNGYAVFHSCKGLKSVIVENGDDEWADGIFMDCSSLETAELYSNNLRSTWTFWNCTSLKSVTFRDAYSGNKYHDQNFYNNPSDLVFNVPDGAAEGYLKNGYVNLSDKSALPLAREEFEAEATSITMMVDELADGDKTTLMNAISDARSIVNDAEDYPTIFIQIATIKRASMSFLSTATLPQGFDVTAATVANPNFDRFVLGWKFDTHTYNKVGFEDSEISNGDISLNKYLKYCVQDGNGGKIYQTLSNLPAGVYRLEADVYTQNDFGEAKGFSLFANNMAVSTNTETDKPEHFSVKFEVPTAKDVAIGFNVVHYNFTWMGADNFRLYYEGEVAELPQGADLVSGDTPLYLYNVDADKYLSAGHSMDTHALLDEGGLPVRLTQDSGTGLWQIYFLEGSVNDQLLFQDNEGDGTEVYVDYNSAGSEDADVAWWSITDAGNGTYLIQNKKRLGSDAWLGNNPARMDTQNNYTGVSYTDLISNATATDNTHWMLFTKDAYDLTGAKRRLMNTILRLENDDKEDSESMLASAHAVYGNESATLKEIIDMITLLNSQIGMPKAGEPVDMTAVIVNPRFENNTTEGWTGATVVGGRSDATTSQEHEFFEKNFNMYQLITGVPNGRYLLKWKGFHRPGNWEATCSDFASGTDNASAVVYANSVEKTMKNLASHKSIVRLDDGDVEYGGNYYPNSMEGTRKYFDAGYYADELEVEVTDNVLTIGVKDSQMGGEHWVIFSDFELYILENAETYHNRLVASNISSVPGGSATLPISLKNEDKIVSFSVEVRLPEGVVPKTDGNGNIIVKKSARVPMTVNGNLTADGTCRFAALTTGQPIEGTDGEIFSFVVQPAGTMALGDYTVQLSKVKLINDQLLRIQPFDATSTLTLKKAATGDVNGDGEVDILDATLIVYYVLGRNVTLNIEAGDVNGDSEVDILDATLIVYRVLGRDTNPAAARLQQVLDPQ